MLQWWGRHFDICRACIQRCLHSQVFPCVPHSNGGEPELCEFAPNVAWDSVLCWEMANLVISFSISEPFSNVYGNSFTPGNNICCSFQPYSEDETMSSVE